MKIARLAGLMFGVVMALSLVAASAAFAEPEFKPTGATFTGLGLGTDVLRAGGNTVECTHNTSSGTISSATLAGGVTVDFTGCKSTNNGKEFCTVKSTNTSNGGLILTLPLHGVLGLILPKGSGTGVGLLLLPVANKKFVILASNACTVETSVTGDVVGEVEPTLKSQTTGKLLFRKGETGESIKDFDLSTGGLVKPELEAFGTIASQETTEDITYSAATEVT